MCAAICPPLGRLDFDGLAAADPKLFLAFAGKDSLDPPPSLADAEERFPDARIVYLEDADHFLLGAEGEVAKPALDFVVQAS